MVHPTSQFMGVIPPRSICITREMSICITCEMSICFTREMPISIARETSFYAREWRILNTVDLGTCDLSGGVCNRISRTKRLQF